MNKIKMSKCESCKCNTYLPRPNQTTKLKNLLKSWIKEIYHNELDLDVDVSTIWIYRRANSIMKAELTITYTDPKGNLVGKKTEISINTDTMKIVGDKNE